MCRRAAFMASMIAAVGLVYAPAVQADPPTPLGCSDGVSYLYDGSYLPEEYDEWIRSPSTDTGCCVNASSYSQTCDSYQTVCAVSDAGTLTVTKVGDIDGDHNLIYAHPICRAATADRIVLSARFRVTPDVPEGEHPYNGALAYTHAALDIIDGTKWASIRLGRVLEDHDDKVAGQMFVGISGQPTSQANFSYGLGFYSPTGFSIEQFHQYDIVLTHPDGPCSEVDPPNTPGKVEVYIDGGPTPLLQAEYCNLIDAPETPWGSALVLFETDRGISQFAYVGYSVCGGTCENEPPDCTSAAASTTTLTPNDDAMVPISISGVTDADGDPVAITIDQVTTDEPVSLPIVAQTPTGSATPPPTATPHADVTGLLTRQVSLRRTADPAANGRYYHLHFTARDGQSGSCSGVVDVRVPSDGNALSDVIDDSPERATCGAGSAGTQSYLANTRLNPCPPAPTPIFMTQPVADTELCDIEPLGRVGNGHIVPKNDLLFEFPPVAAGCESNMERDPTLKWAVHAPASGRITQVIANSRPSENMVDYQIIMKTCEEVTLTFDHVLTLNSELLEQLNRTRDPYAFLQDSYLAGGSTGFEPVALKIVDVPVTEGEVLGFAGNSHQLTVALNDSRTRVPFIRPDRVIPPDALNTKEAAEALEVEYALAKNFRDWALNYGLSGVCFMDYLENTQADPLRDLLLTNWSTAQCGLISHDIDGHAQGTWFNLTELLSAPSMFDNENFAVTLTVDAHDSAKRVFSFGSSAVTRSGTWSGDLNRHVKFEPDGTECSSNRHNCDFADVRPDAGIYCYDNLTPGPAPIDGSILLEMTGRHEMHLWLRDGTDCSDSPRNWPNDSTPVLLAR